MRRRLLAIAAPILLGAAPPGRVMLGQYGGWGAFRDAAPARCFAIARPISGRAGQPTLAIATWPRQRAHDQLHVRLSRVARGEAWLEVGGTRVALVVRGNEAWTPSARDDGRVAAAMRRGGLLQMRATDMRGRRFRDRYVLDGAASAIDAMRLGCLPD